MNGRLLALATGLSIVSSGAQTPPPRPPRPAPAPSPAPRRLVTPPTPEPTVMDLVWPAPMPPLHAVAPMIAWPPFPALPALPVDHPLLALAPMAPMPPEAPFPAIAPDAALLGPVPPLWELSQDRVRQRERELQERMRERQQEMQEQMRERQHELQDSMRERQEELEWQEKIRHSELEARQFDMQLRMSTAFRDGFRFEMGGPVLADVRIATTPPAPWRTEDQADSLYRAAREMLNRGEYRRAAAMFTDIAQKHPNSAYAPDALYWHAFSLYRIGGTPDLRGALAALETQRTKYPNARTQADARTLATRIRGALAARGDAAAAAEIRGTASDSALQCDREEQTVRVEALKALTESDPEGAMPVLQRTLSRKDECSANLRNTAVWIIGSKRRDTPAIALLSQVARTDPSVEVRGSALEWLARMPGEDALATIEALSRDSTEERIQRAAVRALVAHPSARARQLVRGVVERADAPERLRLEALSAFDKDRSTSEDVTWLRGLYTRTENTRVKSRIVSALTRIGGPEVDQWLLAVARNPDEDSETRSYALRRVAETQPIVELGRLYDAAAQRTVRESIIEALGRRSEPEATDKLIEIVKNGTDPQLRSRAIGALSRKKDPRTMQLLMELVSK